MDEKQPLRNLSFYVDPLEGPVFIEITDEQYQALKKMAMDSMNNVGKAVPVPPELTKKLNEMLLPSICEKIQVLKSRQGPGAISMGSLVEYDHTAWRFVDD